MGTKGKSKPRFTAEAKREALEMLERGDVTRGQLAKDLGVPPSTLWRWQQKRDADTGTPLSAKERRRLKNLEKENERLKLENEILKKARTFSVKRRS